MTRFSQKPLEAPKKVIGREGPPPAPPAVTLRALPARNALVPHTVLLDNSLADFTTSLDGAARSAHAVAKHNYLIRTLPRELDPEGLSRIKLADALRNSRALLGLLDLPPETRTLTGHTQDNRNALVGAKTRPSSARAQTPASALRASASEPAPAFVQLNLPFETTSHVTRSPLLLNNTHDFAQKILMDPAGGADGTLVSPVAAPATRAASVEGSTPAAAAAITTAASLPRPRVLVSVMKVGVSGAPGSGDGAEGGTLRPRPSSAQPQARHRADPELVGAPPPPVKQPAAAEGVTLIGEEAAGGGEEASNTAVATGPGAAPAGGSDAATAARLPRRRPLSASAATGRGSSEGAGIISGSSTSVALNPLAKSGAGAAEPQAQAEARRSTVLSAGAAAAAAARQRAASAREQLKLDQRRFVVAGAGQQAGATVAGVVGADQRQSVGRQGAPAASSLGLVRAHQMALAVRRANGGATGERTTTGGAAAAAATQQGAAIAAAAAASSADAAVAAAAAALDAALTARLRALAAASAAASGSTLDLDGGEGGADGLASDTALWAYMQMVPLDAQLKLYLAALAAIADPERQQRKQAQALRRKKAGAPDHAQASVGAANEADARAAHARAHAHSSACRCGFGPTLLRVHSFLRRYADEMRRKLAAAEDAEDFLRQRVEQLEARELGRPGEGGPEGNVTDSPVLPGAQSLGGIRVSLGLATGGVTIRTASLACDSHADSELPAPEQPALACDKVLMTQLTELKMRLAAIQDENIALRQQLSTHQNA